MAKEDSQLEPHFFLKDLTTPIAARISDESKAKATVVVLRSDLLESSMRLRDRLIKEGYEVKLETYYLDQLEIDPITGIPEYSEKLAAVIQHAKSSLDKTGLLSIMTHGNDLTVNINSRYDENTIAKILIHHGLCESDLKELMIRYEGCKVARKNEQGENRAKRLFDMLHAHGAGNFLGVASTELITRTKENKIADSVFKVSDIIQLFQDEEASISEELKNLESLAESDPVAIDTLNSKLSDVRDSLFELEQHIEIDTLELEKSSSILEVEVQLPSGTNSRILKPPRLLSHDGNTLEFTRFFKADKKTSSSEVKEIDTIEELRKESLRGEELVNRAVSNKTTVLRYKSNRMR